MNYRTDAAIRQLILGPISLQNEEEIAKALELIENGDNWVLFAVAPGIKGC